MCPASRAHEVRHTIVLHTKLKKKIRMPMLLHSVARLYGDPVPTQNVKPHCARVLP